ncbi:MAG: bifunctional demethylmenaquinone methyltransferase/2-methoxy-6-polyprenyl-1,4-benzoquinol methylase UbiE [Opitutales bacterium]|nr:bifunctional demethylmenaquinone methyltransferase/2-methoxy-6-polyprenyl-1,4-benzoquinol methylase UbiE [Opitutales bacterium]
MPEGIKVQKMFAGIAKRYDLANTLLSGGACHYWARKLVRLVAKEKPQQIADLATGSGDIAFALRKRLPEAEIGAYDFCEAMLDVARERQQRQNTQPEIRFAFGDCMQLPLESDSTDALTIAYGVRNFEDRPRGLRELHRILRPGGKAFILEFTQPATLFRPFYYLYLKLALPLIAWAITGDRKAYDYLAGSIESFPPKEKLSEELRDAGFSEVRALGLTFSIVAVHIATK